MGVSSAATQNFHTLNGIPLLRMTERSWGCHRTLSTSEEWTRRVPAHAAVLRSHSLMVWSADPVATTLGSRRFQSENSTLSVWLPGTSRYGCFGSTVLYWSCGGGDGRRLGGDGLGNRRSGGAKQGRVVPSPNCGVGPAAGGGVGDTLWGGGAKKPGDWGKKKLKK